MAAGHPGQRPALARAQPLREILATPVLANSHVLAGGAGLDRLVERLNIMEVPDIVPWVKPHEFLLTTAYPLREHPEDLTTLVADLDDAGLAGLGIKLGRYIDTLPAAMLEVADQRHFPVVQLPNDVSFDEVFNEVLTALLNQQARQLARSERIHHAFLKLVLDGQGLPAIAVQLAELVDGPAAILSADAEILASARTEHVDGWPSRTGTDHPRARLRDSGHTLEVAGAEIACRSVPISAGPRLYGHVVALAGDRPPADDRLAMENAATVAALAITKKMEVFAVEEKYQSDLMHDLLTGRVRDTADALRRAESFGWGLDQRLIVLVVQFDEPAAPVVPDDVLRRPPLLTTVSRHITERDPAAAVARFSDELVVLTEAFEGATARDDAKAFARRITQHASAASGVSVSGGLSRPVTALADVPVAYEQATSAVRIGRQVDGNGVVAHFDDLGVYRVLSLIDDVDELRRFATETLGELAADTSQAADLRHTLEVLLETNVNVAEAARRLHFHYNTLRYRIEKLEQLVGPFTQDARVRVDVQLALLILNMRGIAPER